MINRIKKYSIYLVSVILVLTTTVNLWVPIAIKVTGFEQIFLIKDFFLFLLGVCFLAISFRYYKDTKDKITLLPILLLLIINLYLILSASFVHGLWQGEIDIRALIFGYYFEFWWLNFLLLAYCGIYSLVKSNSLQTKDFWLLRVVFYTLLVLNLAQSTFNIATNSNLLQDLGLRSETELNSFDDTCHSPDSVNGGCRQQGFFSHPLYFSGYLLFAIFVLVFDFLKDLNSSKKDFPKLFYQFSLLILTTVIAWFTYSRFVWPPILIFWIVLLLNLPINKKSLSEIIPKKIKYILAAVLIFGNIFAGPAFIFLERDLRESLDLPEIINKEYSTNAHQSHIDLNWEIINSDSQTFWVGRGLGSIGSSAREKYQPDIKENNSVYKDFAPRARQIGFPGLSFLIADSWYLSIWINTGIFGLIFYILVLLGLLVFPFFVFKKVLSSQSLLYLTFVTAILSTNFYNQLFEGQNIHFSLLFGLQLLAYPLESHKSKGK